MKVVHALLKGASVLFFSILFFLILTPLSILLRVMRIDLLKLKIDPELKSYWVSRPNEQAQKNSMHSQF